MIPVHLNFTGADRARRAALYRGELFNYSPSPAAEAFAAFARGLVEEAFDGVEPRTAQNTMPVERFVEILAELKPKFIHHPESKVLLRALLEEHGCNLEQTYFDVPRLRSSTSHGYLTSGIAYAWHPHRDTWYSAPRQQLNYWFPVYEIEAGNGMAFHLDHFDTPVANDSAKYNYYQWNLLHRRAAASNVKKDDRPLPGPTEEVDVSNSLTLVAPPGGVMIFSSQHLHSSVPNMTGKTRFSIDFRTVHIGDIEAGKGAPLVDADCTGSAIRDYIRASDFAPMPEHIVELFNDGTENGGELLYEENRKRLRSEHAAG
ncbi:MAG: hypothetical protein PVI23_00745 [Maricaulaceae bacterium]|jgi:hypothetical protein